MIAVAMPVIPLAASAVLRSRCLTRSEHRAEIDLLSGKQMESRVVERPSVRRAIPGDPSPRSPGKKIQNHGPVAVRAPLSSKTLARGR
jgi:hypothetical protein